MKEVYTKFVNFVKLNVEIPKIYRTREEPKVRNYYRGKDNFYYLWGEIENPQSYECIPNYPDVVRDLIAFVFCENLEEKEQYWIRKKIGNYRVFDTGKPIPHSFEDAIEMAAEEAGR